MLIDGLGEILADALSEILALNSDGLTDALSNDGDGLNSDGLADSADGAADTLGEILIAEGEALKSDGLTLNRLGLTDNNEVDGLADNTDGDGLKSILVILIPICDSSVGAAIPAR